MRRTKTKVLSFLLSLAMLCSLAVPTAFAADSRYNDTTNHWAETAIERWSDYGIIEGYGDAFNPDNSITRGQMATILSKTLGLTEEAENPFTDISADDWYAPYVLRCYKAGIMLGDNGKATPDAEITRQEAMTMFCRAFGIKADETADLISFKDSGAIADWALPYVSALINGGIVSGVSSDMIAPADSMSRASLVTILDRAVIQYINTSGEYSLTDKDGIILVTAGDTTLKGETKADILISQATDGKAVTFKDATVTGEVTVQADTKIITNNAKIPEIDATIEDITVVEDKKSSTTRRPSGGSSGGSSRPSVSNLTISEEKAVTSGTYNNVTITDAVADGEVTLSNITIKGDLTIKGGGSSSIKLDNCTIEGKVIMAKETGEVPRLELTNTPVTTVEVQKPAIIEAVDSASTVTKIEATADIEIKGENTKVDTLAVPETAESSVAVTVTAGSVATVEAKAETSVSGGNNLVNTIIATAAVTTNSATVQKVEIPETATESVSVTVTGDEAVDIEINSANGAAVTGANVTVSTTLETAPDNITIGGEAVTHIHKWGEPNIMPPECEVNGFKRYECIADGCGDTAKIKIEETPKLGHNYGDWKEGEKGFHIRECANNKNHIEQVGHDWDKGTITTEANCGQDGIKTYTCPTCKATETETIPKPDHNWGEWAKVDATSHKRVCNNNKEHTETADHTPIIDAEIEATCTETGKTEGSHCDICKSVIVEQTTTPALNHDFTGEYEKDADGHWHICSRDNCEETDTKAGHTYNTTNCAEVATCTACSYEKAAGEHTWGKWEKVDDTNHKHTCSSCNEPETAGHSWNDGEITTEPTETTEGVKTFTCTDCGATKTESVPVLNATKIVLTEDNGTIKATWSDYGYTKYYVKVLDSTGATATYTACYNGFYGVENIGSILPIPTEGTKTYSLVVYAVNDSYQIGEELDRLENAIQVTVSGEAVNYEMDFNNPETGKHTVTLTGSTLPTGVGMREYWYKSTGSSAGHGYSGSISATETESKTIEDGYVYDLRIVSALSLEEQTVKATITPPSQKTYIAPKITLVQEDSTIRATWTGVEDAQCLFELVDSNGNAVNTGISNTNENGTGDLAVNLPRLETGSETYSIVLYSLDANYNKGSELARLENAIEVTVSGDAVEYDMTFNDGQDGTHTITWKDNQLPTGIYQLGTWYDKNGAENGGKTSGTISTPAGASKVLQDGDTYDLRILTVYTLDGQTLKATITPPSKKTYTAPEVE